MTKIFKVLISSLLILIVSIMSVSAVTVSSECDISDINVPIDTAVSNAAIGQTLDIKAKSVILMEPKTKTVLYESQSDEKLAPASIT